VIGTVLRSERPRLLKLTFDAPVTCRRRAPVVSFEIERSHEIVRLTVSHDNLPDDQARAPVAAGWPAVCGNLKSLVETGEVLPPGAREMTLGFASRDQLVDTGINPCVCRNCVATSLGLWPPIEVSRLSSRIVWVVSSALTRSIVSVKSGPSVAAAD
jgi:hypothetical protein